MALPRGYADLPYERDTLYGAAEPGPQYSAEPGAYMGLSSPTALMPYDRGDIGQAYGAGQDGYGMTPIPPQGNTLQGAAWSPGQGREGADMMRGQPGTEARTGFGPSPNFPEEAGGATYGSVPRSQQKARPYNTEGFGWDGPQPANDNQAPQGMTPIAPQGNTLQGGYGAPSGRQVDQRGSAQPGAWNQGQRQSQPTQGGYGMQAVPSQGNTLQGSRTDFSRPNEQKPTQPQQSWNQAQPKSAQPQQPQASFSAAPKPPAAQPQPQSGFGGMIAHAKQATQKPKGQGF